MSDSSVERLLDALAKKLPANAARSTVELAFRAAIDAVPKSKLRDKLLLKEGLWIRTLLRRLKGKAKEEVADVTVQEDQDDKEDEGTSGQLVAPAAAYKGMEHSSPGECLSRCMSLLKDAVVSLNPAAKGEEALQGLVALLPTEGRTQTWELDMDSLELIVHMMPVAATVLGVMGRRDSPVAWRRFLGLALSAPLHVEVPGAKEDDIKEVAARLGGTAALLAGPKAARTALRIAIFRCQSPPSSKKLLARLVPAALPLLHAAVGEGLVAAADPSCGDLVALLFGLLFLHSAGRHGLGAKTSLLEAREGLASAIGRGFNATPLLPELRKVVEEQSSLPKRSKSLLKKIDAVLAERRASASASLAVILECLEVFSDSLRPQQLQRLATFSGLPVGDDENTDAPAAAARARGDLFFEDTAGEAPLENLLAGRSAASVEAAADVRKRTLEALEGVEELRGVGEEVEDDEPEDEDPEGAGVPQKKPCDKPGGSKHLRRREKGSV